MVNLSRLASVFQKACNLFLLPKLLSMLSVVRTGYALAKLIALSQERFFDHCLPYRLTELTSPF